MSGSEPRGHAAPTRVALFVPCYVDQLAPRVAEATLRVLEAAGCQVDYDPEQTCCGQPFLNLGARREAAGLAQRHLERFAGAEAVVCPSASCVATVRHRYPEVGVGDEAEDAALRSRTFELGEFLVRRLGRSRLGARYPHRVALLESCHGLRDLALGSPSEAAGRPEPGVTERLLREVEGLELLRPDPSDECCGFGGAFAVRYPTVSGRMGRARLRALAETGAEVVTGTDLSCLVHLEGLRLREGHGPRAVHLAEILASRGDA